MAVIRVPVARPVGGSAVADALKGLGQLGFLYGDLKRDEERRKLERESIDERKELRKLQKDKAQLDIDKYRRDTAEETALETGAENVANAQDLQSRVAPLLEQVNRQPLEITTPGLSTTMTLPVNPNAPVGPAGPQDIGLGDQPPPPEAPMETTQIERKPEGMIRVPRLEDILSEELKQKITIPGMESVGVPSREVSPTRMALDRFRASQRDVRAKQAVEHPPIGFPDDPSLPVTLRGQTFEYGHPMYETAKRASQDYASSMFREEKTKEPGALKQVYDRVTGDLSWADDDTIRRAGNRYQPPGAKPKDGDSDDEVVAMGRARNKYLREALVAAPRDDEGRVKPAGEWTNEDRASFARNLGPDIQNQAVQVSEYRSQLSDVGRNKEERLAISAAAGYLNPYYDSKNFVEATRYAKTLPDMKQSANDAIADAARVFKNIEAVAEKDFLGRTRFPWVNKGVKWFKENLGGMGANERRLQTDMIALAQEFATAENNGKVPGTAVVDAKLKLLLAADDPKALEATIREQIGLTVNRLVTKENQYVDYYGRIPDRSFLSPQTWELAKEWGFDDEIRGTGLQVLPGEERSAPGGGAAGGQAEEECPPASDGSPCGTRATKGGRLSEWDGTGWKALSPQEAVAPGTGPLARPQDDVLSTFYGVGGS